LSAMVLRVPPLRERPREIPMLAERFAAEACELAGRSAVPVSARAMEILREHVWPGNIRELRNVMNAAVMMCDGAQVDPEHLPQEVLASARGEQLRPDRVRNETIRFAIGVPSEAVPLEEELRSIERERIEQALRECDGNQTRAAEVLGMPRRTLVYKISTLGIAVPKRRRAKKRE